MAYTTAGLALQAAQTNIRPTQGLLSTASAAALPDHQRPVMSATLSTVPGSTPVTSCCSTGRPVIADPLTGQTVCSCQLTPSLAMSYPRLASLPDSLYGSAAYTAQALMASSPFAAAAAASNGSPDTAALYSPFTSMSPYELKDAAEMYRGLTQTPSGLLTYDPTAMFAYPFGAGYGGMDLSAARRNKNATRETTSTLKAWLYEHRKNPYPTKGEKIMLAIITKMTLTQVSTWFANARRRLKKDNKMTWTPKNGSGADSDNDDEDNVGHQGNDRDGEGDLDVGSSYNNEDNQENNRLNDSHDSIDIDTLSDKDPSELNNRDSEGPCPRDQAGSPLCQSSDKDRRPTTSDSEDDPNRTPTHRSPTHPTDRPDTHHPALGSHPHHHHHHHHPHHHHHLNNRMPSQSQPPMSLASSVLQRTPAPHPGLFAPYPGMPRMALPMTPPHSDLPGLRPTGHTLPPSSSSSVPPTNGALNHRSESPSSEGHTKDSTSNTNNNNKPRIWSLADIVTSSSSSSSSSSNQHRTSSPPVSVGVTHPVRPSPTGPPPPPQAPGLSPSALGSLRAWTEATGGHYGLAAAAAAAAAQGLPHPYSRGPAPPPPPPGVSIGMHGAFSMAAGGISLMAQHASHQNGFYPRPAERPPIGESQRAESPSSSHESHNKTAFKPVVKSKPTEINA